MNMGGFQLSRDRCREPGKGLGATRHVQNHRNNDGRCPQHDMHSCLRHFVAGRHPAACLQCSPPPAHQTRVNTLILHFQTVSSCYCILKFEDISSLLSTLSPAHCNCHLCDYCMPVWYGWHGIEAGLFQLLLAVTEGNMLA